MLVFGAELLNHSWGLGYYVGGLGGIPVGMFTAAQTHHKRVFLTVLKGFLETGELNRREVCGFSTFQGIV